MKLEHDFTVHAPLAQAWNVLLDVERVARCLPGAASGAVAYEDTEVGRLPVGPAGDAALAAAGGAGTQARQRRSPEVLHLGAASRAAVAKRAVPVVAALALLGAAVAGYLRRRR